MKVTITNHSKAAQGVHHAGGVAWIAPGATSAPLELGEDHHTRATELSFLQVEPVKAPKAGKAKADEAEDAASE